MRASLFACLSLGSAELAPEEIRCLASPRCRGCCRVPPRQARSPISCQGHYMFNRPVCEGWPILDTPMAADHLSEPLGREPRAQQVGAHLAPALGRAQAAGGLDQSDRAQSRPWHVSPRYASTAASESTHWSRTSRTPMALADLAPMVPVVGGKLGTVTLAGWAEQTYNRGTRLAVNSTHVEKRRSIL